jgi:hypothetical protein
MARPPFTKMPFNTLLPREPAVTTLEVVAIRSPPVYLIGAGCRPTPAR